MTKETATETASVQTQESQLDMILRTHQMDQALLANMDACAEAGIALAKKGAKSIGEEFAIVCAYDDLKSMMMGSERLVSMAMKMQNNPMYFKTDKAEGYPAATVVDCMIQARLMGLLWRGNQFNILQGRLYLTKEGADALLTEIGIPHSIVVGTFSYGLSIKGGIDRNGRQMADVVTVDVPVTVYWEDDGRQMQKEMSFNIRMNANTTIDNVNGKAESHALKWLYKYISSKTGIASIGFAEVDDIPGIQKQNVITAAKAKALKPRTVKDDIAERVQGALDALGETVQATDLLKWLDGRGTPVSSMEDCDELLKYLPGTIEAMRNEMASAA